MEIINQTNRTLLLDVINPDMMDLVTLVGDVKGLDSLNLRYGLFMTLTLSQ